MSTDIRWKQRFQNFENVLHLLENALLIDTPDISQKAGTIHFFELSFELSWKVMKDYLEDQGFLELRSPRDSIKKAFEVGLIVDGHTWMEALKNRNLTTHTYDEALADKVVADIRKSYFPILKQFQESLKGKQ
ncbi:nucleotidyltransferase substrate binding protein [soil metagenome]